MLTWFLTPRLVYKKVFNDYSISWYSDIDGIPWNTDNASFCIRLLNFIPCRYWHHVWNTAISPTLTPGVWNSQSIIGHQSPSFSIKGKFRALGWWNPRRQRAAGRNARDCRGASGSGFPWKQIFSTNSWAENGSFYLLNSMNPSEGDCVSSAVPCGVLTKCFVSLLLVGLFAFDTGLL